MVTTETTSGLVQKFGKNAKDSGSIGVQVAILTERIKDLTAHFEKNKKDHSGMRGLMRMIGKRRALLKYLSSKDEAGYQKLIGDLGIRK
jgi:small subunit ribosomal protein S15